MTKEEVKDKLIDTLPDKRIYDVASKIVATTINGTQFILKENEDYDDEVVVLTKYHKYNDMNKIVEAVTGVEILIMPGFYSDVETAKLLIEL